MREKKENRDILIFKRKKKTFSFVKHGTGLLKIGLDLNPIILFCAIHVMLETIKQHLRILMLKQYNTGRTWERWGGGGVGRYAVILLWREEGGWQVCLMFSV